MRVVLDSSVLVAAHISRAGVCAELVEEILLGHDLVLSEFILVELREKLFIQFGFPKSIIVILWGNRVRHAATAEPRTVTGHFGQSPVSKTVGVFGKQLGTDSEQIRCNISAQRSEKP